MQGNGLLPDVRKIAVLRANALGDFIFSLPALESLRRAYPQAEITLLGKKWHADFLAGRPGPIDRVVVIPPYKGVGLEEYDTGTIDESEIDRFFDCMQQESFDLAIQLHGGGRNSNPFVKRLGARVTVGLQAPDAPSLDRTVRYVYFQLEPLRYLEVVSLVGGGPVSLEPHINITADDLTEAHRIYRLIDEPFAVIHPGVSKIDRQWPVEKFAEVGDALRRQGLHVVLTGSRGEEELTHAVGARMAHESFDACGLLSVAGLAGLLSRAALCVANDTGPLHLAEAVGCRTVGIYWCFNLVNGAPLTRSRHRPLVSWQLECPACGASQVTSPCAHRVSYVSDVPVADVLEQAMDLLDKAYLAGRQPPVLQTQRHELCNNQSLEAVTIERTG